MLLKRKSWVNTKRVYKVPVSILRPYETFQSWCRFRLTDTSIQALQSALLISALNSSSEPTTSQLLSSPVLSDGTSLPDDSLASPDIFSSAIGATSQSTPSRKPSILVQSENPLLNGSMAALGEPQTQPPDAIGYDSTKASSGEIGIEGTDDPRVSLSYNESPFYMLFPFDTGPSCSRTEIEDHDSMITSPLLPPPATIDNTRMRYKSRRRARSIISTCVALVGISIVAVFILVPKKATYFAFASYL